MSTSLFLFVLISATLHATWNFVARRTGGNLTISWWSLWISCLFLLPFVLNVAATQGILEFVDMLSVGWWYILATGIIHTIYFWLLARAYKFGEISIVYPIARGSGIGLTGFLGWLILDENLNLPGIIGIGSICLGIFCIAFPLVKQTNSVKKGLISALGVGATIVSYSLIDKVGVNIVNPIVYIFGMFFLSGAFLTPFVIRKNAETLYTQLKSFWGSAIVISIGSTGAYLMILFAMTMGKIGYIVALREFAVAIGVILGFTFLKETITPRKVVALFMIICGLIFIKFG